MIYLMVLLGVAMVIGPVFWLRPSPGQQRLARKRAKARELGLDIRITDLPQTHRSTVRREDAVQGAVYRLMVRDPRTVLAKNHRCVRDTLGVWEQEGDALPQRLQDTLELVQTQLPPDVVAVELGPQGPGIFWREMGDEKTVEQVAAQLRLLLTAMQI